MKQLDFKNYSLQNIKPGIMHVPSNNISWEKIHINARQGWFNEYFFYQELLILMINVSTD